MLRSSMAFLDSADGKRFTRDPPEFRPSWPDPNSGDSRYLEIRKLAAGFTNGLEYFKDFFGGSVGVYDA